MGLLDTQLLCLLCVAVILVRAERNNTVITIAHLYLESAEIAEAVVQNAIDNLYTDGILPTWIQFRIIYLPKCGAYDALGSIVDLSRTVDVDLYLGPFCTSGMVPVSLLGTYWKKLSLGYVSTGPELANKNLFKYFSRFHPTQAGVMSGILSITDHFGWQQIAVVRLDKFGDGCSLIESALDGLLKTHQLTVSYFGIIESSDKNFTSTLHEIKQSARVIVMCNAYKYADMPDRLGTRDILMEADKMGMVSPEYIWLLVQPANTKGNTPPWKLLPTTEVDPLDEQAKNCYRSVIIIKPEGANDRNMKYIDDVTMKKLNQSVYGSSMMMQYPFMNDALHQYGVAINQSIQANGSHPDFSGPALIEYFRCALFEGYSGHVALDRWAERIPSYALLSFDADETFSLMGVFEGHIKNCKSSDEIEFEYIPVRNSNWRTAGNTVPRDKPVCDFDGSLCIADKTWIYILASGISAVTILSGAMLYRWNSRRKEEKEIYGTGWKINARDINVLSTKAGQTRRSIQSVRSIQSMKSMQSIRTLTKQDLHLFVDQTFDEGETEEWDGFYQGTEHIKVKVYPRNLEIMFSRENLIILKTLRHLNHENLSAFIGLCVDHPQVIGFVWQASERGCLEDLIFAAEINLDIVFKTSMLRDLTKGLDFLHRSEVKYHGELTAVNCVVSSRWIVRIQNFGAVRLATDLVKNGQLAAPKQDTKMLLHMAPEVLRKQSLKEHQLQQCDVYSLAMVVYQIVTRESLYHNESGSPDELIARIMKPSDKAIMRPTFDLSSPEQTLLQGLLADMWSEDPLRRPDSGAVRQKIQSLMKKHTNNIMDHMLVMMEKYTDNLENIVKERTQQVEEENKRSEALLCQLLPPSIAADLKKGLTILPESYDCATIYFSDIVGFTNTCSMCTPLQVVNMLNSLFSLVDKVISQFDVYKVETIGDAYLIASGLPVRNGDQHGCQIPNMALTIRKKLLGYTIPHLIDKKVRMRFGIHTGSVATGVIGSVMPRFCLFGDTVNLASRMESTGEPMKIQITEETKNFVEKFHANRFEMVYRGEISIKGKGDRKTYWLEWPKDVTY